MGTTALIIPAAGSGSRLNRDIPKPYLSIAGRTILEYTLSRFIPVGTLSEVVIAASGPWKDKAEAILSKVIPPPISCRVTEGGKERQHSVANALKCIQSAEWIIVHDAARPFVTPAQVEQCLQAAYLSGSAVLGVPSRSTIKRLDDEMKIRETPDRTFLWEAQTPQVFRKDILVDAYKKAAKNNVTATDDASIVEQAGGVVKMVKGSHSNFKITYPVDLRLAELLIKDQE